MIRAWVAWVLTLAGFLGTAAASANAESRVLRHVECPRLAQLPALKLVVRSSEVLAKLGVGDGVALDFTKEMGILVSLGVGKDSVESTKIENVTEADGKITVAVKKIGFEEMLSGNGQQRYLSYDFVVVPASKLPVEGFVEDVSPSPGLYATSSLLVLNSGVTWVSFRDRANSRNFDVKKVESSSPATGHLANLDSVAWDIGPAEEPSGVRLRLRALKGGAGAECDYEYVKGKYAPPPTPPANATKAQREAWKNTKPPVQRDVLIAGIVAAYKTTPGNAETAADQVLYGYMGKIDKDVGHVLIAAIHKSDLNAESFRKYIGSDAKTFRTEAFLDTVDEVGKNGSLRWSKSYFKAETTIDGVGKVTVAYCEELKLFQMKVDDVQTTKIADLRQQAAKLAGWLGMNLSDEQIQSLQFSFAVKREK
jgi:hypothetical protein